MSGESIVAGIYTWKAIRRLGLKTYTWRHLVSLTLGKGFLTLEDPCWHPIVIWQQKDVQKSTEMGIQVISSLPFPENLILHSISREFVAELIGTIIFVFIAKATGFSLAVSTQEVRKKLYFNEKLYKLHILLIANCTFCELQIAHFANCKVHILQIAHFANCKLHVLQIL